MKFHMRHLNSVEKMYLFEKERIEILSSGNPSRVGVWYVHKEY